MNKNLQQSLAHVLWIGGATDAGKTTVSQMIAEQNDLQLYNYDHHDLPQVQQLAKTIPHYHNFLNASDDERWVHPTVEALLQRALQAFQDRFPLVIEELLSLPTKPPIVAEGFGFTPEIIQPILSNKSQAIWLVPTEEFKKKSMQQRGKFKRRLQFSDPEKAINNLLERDMLLAELVKEQAQQGDLKLLVIDGSRSAEEIAVLVVQHFQQHLQYLNGPTR